MNRKLKTLTLRRKNKRYNYYLNLDSCTGNVSKTIYHIFLLKYYNNYHNLRNIDVIQQIDSELFGLEKTKILNLVHV